MNFLYALSVACACGVSTFCQARPGSEEIHNASCQIENGVRACASYGDDDEFLGDEDSPQHTSLLQKSPVRLLRATEMSGRQSSGPTYALAHDASPSCAGSATSESCSASRCGKISDDCVPALWDEKRNCKGLTPSSACRKLLRGFMDTLQDWTLMITSSGGGGHMVASDNLEKRQLEARSERLEAYRKLLDSDEVVSELLPSSQEWLRESFGTVVANASVETIDIMTSPCTNGQGDNWTAEWNDIQNEGDIAQIMEYYDWMWMLEGYFGHYCRDFMSSFLENNTRQRGAPPARLIHTANFFISSIAQVVDTVLPPDVKMQFHMTELPTDGADWIYSPMRSMVKYHRQASKRVVFHTVAPLEGGAEKITEYTKLDVSQIALDPFMPIGQEFMEEDALPKPGTPAELSLVAQLPREEQFLGGLQQTFHIAEEDTVMLIMLGSQPTVSAMRDYFYNATLLSPKSHTLWIFLACGKYEESQDSLASNGTVKYRELYEELADAADKYSASDVGQGGTLRLMPFTGQPAQYLLGRADISVTRSGGLTSGELMALGERGDSRKVFLHVEIPSGVASSPPDGEEASWQETVLEKGITPWEAGNARMLMQKLGASVVTPASLQTA